MNATAKFVSSVATTKQLVQLGTTYLNDCLFKNLLSSLSTRTMQSTHYYYYERQLLKYQDLLSQRKRILKTKWPFVKN